MRFLFPLFLCGLIFSCSKGEKNEFDSKITYAIDTSIDPASGDTVFLIAMPSGFTPNQDGVNDVYFAKGFGINNFLMKIYAGNGNLVFTSNDLYKGWNGRVIGSSTISGMGMYDVDISLTDSLGTSHRYLHRITLFN